jgi:protein-tyrosine phosphatase
MIDLHSHILPNLDDGPRTIEDSIQMCRVSYKDGTKTIVATPHILPGIYENDRSTILSKLQELNEAIKKFGVESSEFRVKNFDSTTQRPNDLITQLPNDSMTKLKILPGADVHFSSDILQRLEKKEIVTVNDQGRYLMVEFAFQGIPYQAEEVLFQLLTKGIIPIISHPERNMEIGQRPQRYYEMIRMGCLGQVTAMSLTGEFGPGVRRIAQKLLTNRLIHIIASDAHSTDGRPPILSAAMKAAEKIVGKEEAYKMVTDYPQAVLDGKKPNVPEPLSP